MIVACPNCNRRLRFTNNNHKERFLVLRCPACQKKFKVRSKETTLRALLAHEDAEIRQQLAERISHIGGYSVECQDSEDIIRQLQADVSCVLLLDVAFNGTFPFQLIDKIVAAGNDQHKVVLLPSIYNRTAYKKRPDSLYGADAYLELHHIGDRLLPLLSELFPTLSSLAAGIMPVSIHGGERVLSPQDISAQAGKLARLLIADIVLYHGERLEQCIESGQLDLMFTEQLAEGRRMLAARLPGVVDLQVDFIQQAFDEVCQSYVRGY